MCCIDMVKATVYSNLKTSNLKISKIYLAGVSKIPGLEIILTINSTVSKKITENNIKKLEFKYVNMVPTSEINTYKEEYYVNYSLLIPWNIIEEIINNYLEDDTLIKTFKEKFINEFI